ncbi:MAG TPA: ribosome silencing factor [Candidatus Atribacteria bacterium]|nr:ribosome silencing factor [Candidatus Atribacteria bacterium]HPZ81195.1 ribosome silencing factor [Candidatus Atribacteria bacterium]HQE24483.1 ribosome silencing factor [Candidatus Atribacteria bacterium]
MRIQEKIVLAKKAVESRKAFDLVILDFRGLLVFSDYWLICSGSSTIQTKAVAEEVLKKMEERQLRPFHLEGMEEGEWILIDYGDLMIHIFREEERLFYQLEKLWHRAPLLYSEKEGLNLLEEIH